MNSPFSQHTCIPGIQQSGEGNLPVVDGFTFIFPNVYYLYVGVIYIIRQCVESYLKFTAFSLYVEKDKMNMTIIC